MKVLILCGGQGARAYPHTRRIPKAMMPVAGLPIVEQVMRIYASQGFDEFVLAVGYRKEHLTNYFAGQTRWRVECVDTGDKADTASRVAQCLDRLGNTFHATYCDGLADIDLNALVAFHESYGGGATVTAVPLRSQYGILVTDERDLITNFVEKPTLPEHWINAGFFVFDRDHFPSRCGDNLERDVLPHLAEKRLLRAYRHHGFWRSMDTYKDQQELDALWAPYVEKIEASLAQERTAPHEWLTKRSAVAGPESR
jgi:glucose-1-phosphate cytidylyltransferase